MKGNTSPEYQAVTELDTMALAGNYNNWIWNTIKPFIGKRVLEIGAGIGTFTEYLSDRELLYATDFADNCIAILKNKYSTNSNISIFQLDITDETTVKRLGRADFDTAICLNVLEHIENDLDALKSINTLLSRDGKLVIMIPAFQFAYGSIDKLDGHFRRYSKREIAQKMKIAGYKITANFYFNSIGLLAWYYTNRILKNTTTSANKVKIYDTYFVPILRAIESKVKPVFGQSIIVIGTKA